MHILQVTPRYFPSIGGVEELVRRISEMLVANKIDVTVYSVDLNFTLSKIQKVNGVLVKRFYSLFGDPLYFPEPSFINAIRHEEAEIIHVHNVHTLLPFIVALSKKKEQKFLLQPHYHRFGQSPLRSSLFKLYKYGLKRTVFPRANIVITNSSYEEKILCEDFPSCGKTILIPEGINIKECKNVKHNPTEPKRILYVGALKSYKNVDKVIKAFAYLAKNERKDFRLVIVGEGPEYPVLVNLTRKFDINEFVEWKSGLTRQQLLREYAKASVFIHLSPLESFSRVVYEALLIGVPTVALNFGVTENLVKKGLVEGVNSLDSKKIAEAILRATRKNYPKIIENSNIISSWGDYLNKLIQLYYDLL